MKITFILPSSGISGGVRATVVAANQLLKRGHEVKILCRKDPLNIRTIYHSLAFPIFFPNSYNWLLQFKGERIDFKNLLDYKFDTDEILIGAGMWSSSQLVNLDHLPNRKLQYLHGEHIVNLRERDIVLNSKLPKIVVSSYLKPIVESHNGKILDIIHNGIDTTEYYNSVNESKKDGVGTIYASHISKDPETLLEVLKRIRKQQPLLPIRVFSPHKRPKEIDKKCFWRLPSIKKSRKIYSKSLVWIVASRSEGFSIPILEAMACGCVVVATDCGGTRDIIVDGENGFLVKVGNVKQIVDRVRYLLNNPDLRLGMQSKALMTVKNFTWDKAVDKMESILDKIDNN